MTYPKDGNQKMTDEPIQMEGKVEAAITPARWNKASVASLIAILLVPITYMALTALSTIAPLLFSHMEGTASFVSAIIIMFMFLIFPGVSALAAIISGFIGLVQIKRSGGKGVILAVPGVAMGMLILMIYAAMYYAISIGALH
jgi:hypothetical protein